MFTNSRCHFLTQIWKQPYDTYTSQLRATVQELTSKARVFINKVMGYQKLNIALSSLCLAIWLPLAVIFLLMSTILGYVLSAVFFGFSCYAGYYLYRILWLRNWGRPLSEEKKRKIEQYRKQMRDYQRYNLYSRLSGSPMQRKQTIKLNKPKKNLSLIIKLFIILKF